MSKVDLDLVKLILCRSEMDARKVSSIINEIQEETAIQAAQNEKPPAVRKQHVILVSDPQGILKSHDLTGWVIKIPEEESPYTTEDRLIKSAHDFNVTPKGRRYPVKTIAETCEIVSSRVHKENRVWPQTKEPVLIIRTNNQIPFEQ